MKPKKAPAVIPLEHLLLSPGFRRSFDRLEREHNRDERLLASLRDELHRNAVAHIKHKDTQAQRAKKPRGRGEDGRTMANLIAGVARERPPEEPQREVWSHLGNALEAWAGECAPVRIGGQPAYKYSSATGRTRTLTYKYFGELLRKARSA